MRMYYGPGSSYYKARQKGFWWDMKQLLSAILVLYLIVWAIGYGIVTAVAFTYDTMYDAIIPQPVITSNAVDGEQDTP